MRCARAVSQLRVVNGRVLGAVLNDVDFRSGVYYGGYGYYYHKFYGEDAGEQPGEARMGLGALAQRGPESFAGRRSLD